MSNANEILWICAVYFIHENTSGYLLICFWFQAYDISLFPANGNKTFYAHNCIVQSMDFQSEMN